MSAIVLLQTALKNQQTALKSQTYAYFSDPQCGLFAFDVDFLIVCISKSSQRAKTSFSSDGSFLLTFFVGQTLTR